MFICIFVLNRCLLDGALHRRCVDELLNELGARRLIWDRRRFLSAVEIARAERGLCGG